ncbi:MAG: osmoprotectant transporter permease [Xanthobacteraceae bacterium]|nr:osmoprotectant transporter permease [Xanthobacteraceae bacterium]
MAFVRILLAIDAVAALVALYFFFIGIADGSVSSFNIGLWLALLGSIAAILGGWALNARGQRRAAIAVLSILAVPGFLAGLLILTMLIVQPRWN